MVIAIIVIIFVSFSLAALITGKDKRAYDVLSPSDQINIAGKEWIVSDLAAEYSPIVKIRSSTFSLPLLEIKYNLVPGEETVDLIYYFVWEDEIHPNAFIHTIYKYFRAVYYGIPVRDIEYFQISINRESGIVERIRFETSPGEDYYVNYSKHLIAVYTGGENSIYKKTLIDKSSGEILTQQEDCVVDFQDRHVLVGVITWNHLSGLLHGQNDFDKTYQVSLTNLSDEDYQNGKYVRKSQGDHVTRENKIGLILGWLFSVTFFIISGYLIYRIFVFIRSKDKEKIRNGKK